MVYSDVSRKGFMMCVDATWESHIICIETIKNLWGELSYAWSRTGINSMCFKGLEALFVWHSNTKFYWP